MITGCTTIFKSCPLIDIRKIWVDNYKLVKNLKHLIFKC